MLIFVETLCALSYLVLQFSSLFVLTCREEKLQLEKRQKRKRRVNARLSFAEDLDNETEEEDENSEKFPYLDFGSLLANFFILLLAWFLFLFSYIHKCVCVFCTLFWFWESLNFVQSIWCSLRNCLAFTTSNASK